MAMMFTVVCPHCGNKMRASADHVGHKGRCPGCRALVEITMPAGEGGAIPAGRARAEGRGPAAVQGRVGTTDVPTWVSGLIGLAATALLYLGVFLPFRNQYLGELFLQRGSTPYFSMLVLCWGAAHLALKYRAVKHQQSYADLELELIPLEIGVQITPANVDQFLGHIAKLPAPQRRSILGRRIQGALEHFKGRNSVPEVQDFLATQAEIDASGVDSGYTLLRTFIWISPILGFIGTVIGISQAVTGLKQALVPGSVPPAATAPLPQSAPTPPGAGGSDTTSKLMQGMQQVTNGLATAFDTTLVALIFAIVLVFPTESLRKSEYAMLDRIESFTIESLVRRMSDEKTALSQEDLPEIVRDTLSAAFGEHQKWLAQWQAQVAELGQTVGADFEQCVSRMQSQITLAETDRLKKVEDAGRMLSEIFGQFGDATRSWHDMEQNSGQLGNGVIDAARQIESSLNDTARVGRELLEQQQKLWQGFATSDLGANLLALHREIARLSDQMNAYQTGSIAELQPVNSDAAPKNGKRRGPFGLFKR